jgi:RNA polymerase sigma factor (sigma-70 family)
MARERLDGVLRFLHQLTDDGPGDGELLERFARQRDQDAFTTLLRRHGSLVLGVCRRILQHEADAEDVFQATFLVLARKASSIRKREAVGSWLHGVALRLARQARLRALRRRARERAVVDVPREEAVPEFLWRDLRPVLDEEIAQLPGRYREPFILCHLEGKTNEQAARELALPLGTVLSRLSRGRALLRERLTRRGLTLSTGMLVTALARQADAAVPAAWIERTSRAALLFAAGKGLAAGTVSVSAALLAEGVLKAMFMTRVQMVGAVLLLACMAGTVVYSQAPGDEKPGVNPRFPLQETRPDAAKNPAASGANASRRDQPYQDPTKEAVRLANKLLQEEIEDEKAKLEALHRKLERLKNSGLATPPAEDPELMELKREQRLLQRQLEQVQEDVRLAQQLVEPYMRALQRGAGKGERPLFEIGSHSAEKK